MLICLTGLHASGKGHFSELISQTYENIIVLDKKKIIKELYFSETNKKDENWKTWYNEQYDTNPNSIINRILNMMPKDKIVVLDSVHSNLEWEIIHKIVPDSFLVSIITPSDIRYNLWDKREKEKIDIIEKDKRRIKYWHNANANSSCLSEHVSWAFNGIASDAINVLLFEEFINYCNHYLISNSIESNKVSVRKRKYENR